MAPCGAALRGRGCAAAWAVLCLAAAAAGPAAARLPLGLAAVGPLPSISMGRNSSSGGGSGGTSASVPERYLDPLAGWSVLNPAVFDPNSWLDALTIEWWVRAAGSACRSAQRGACPHAPLAAAC
jgi:hypothetical protein